MILVIKRNGTKVKFDDKKIYKAILKAMKNGSGIVHKESINIVINDIKKYISINNLNEVSIKQIESMVFSNLCELGEIETARSYENYRVIQAFRKTINSTDDGVLGLVERTNKDVMTENSNKNAILTSTQRDLIAGEVSKDIARRKKLPTHIIQAHDDGTIHFHK